MGIKWANEDHNRMKVAFNKKNEDIKCQCPAANRDNVNTLQNNSLIKLPTNNMEPELGDVVPQWN